MKPSFHYLWSARNYYPGSQIFRQGELSHLNRCGLTDLGSNNFAGDDDLDAAVFLPSLVRTVIRHRLGFAQPNGCYIITARKLRDSLSDPLKLDVFRFPHSRFSFSTDLTKRSYAKALCTTTSAFPLTVSNSGRPVRLSLFRWAFVFRLKSVSEPMSSGLTMAVSQFFRSPAILLQITCGLTCVGSLRGSSVPGYSISAKLK
ncbi:MAG: hypothetical protein WB556_25775 [Candidatus Acidiferrum sp.]